jgi:hypothetical protein
MFNKILNHLRGQYLGAIALFVALGGTAYAATSLPASSVGSAQLRNGAVTQKKLAKSSVTAGALDPNSIGAHVVLWAQIRSDGHVISSSPRATVLTSAPSRGIQRIDWHRAISPRCGVFASPQNVEPITAPASAHTVFDSGPVAHGRHDYVFVSTFDANGSNVPENVDVAVVCP